MLDMVKTIKKENPTMSDILTYYAQKVVLYNGETTEVPWNSVVQCTNYNAIHQVQSTLSLHLVRHCTTRSANFKLNWATHNFPLDLHLLELWKVNNWHQDQTR